MFSSKNKLLFLVSILFIVVFVSFTGRAEAAPENVVNTSVSPAAYRPLCDAGTPVDFAVSPSNVNFNLSTGVLSYNINLQWKRCTGDNTRAYAIYSQGPEICPYSGTYGVSGWTTDCVKYIGSPAYVGPGNGLRCWGGTNSQCITPVFSGVRRVENQPSYGINSVSIPMSASNALWAFAPDNGTWTVTQRMCQYYKTGVNFGLNNDNRCVDVSISVTWSGSTQYPFDITLNGQATLNDDENPSSVKYDNVGAKSNYPVNNVNLSRKYVIKRAGSADIDVLPPANPNTQTVNIGTNFYYMPPNPDSRGLSGLQVGDQVCVVVTASPGSGKVKSDGTITIAGIDKQQSFCDRLVNKPFVSFYGGDVSVGGAFLGGNCALASKIETFTNSAYLGSGVNLAAQAIGAINGFASGRNTVRAPKGLSFANTTASPFGGNFGGTQCRPDYFAASSGIPVTSSPSAIDVGSLANGSTRYAGDKTLSGNIQNGVRSAIYIEGNLRITTNGGTNTGISYANPTWATVDDIPSLHVYVKGNITIDSDVQNVTGFYVAQPNTPGTGQILTCAQSNGSRFSDAQLLSSCSTKLTIRGAFISRQTKFLRTNDSMRSATTATETISSSSKSAEVFQLGPEMFLVGPKPEVGTGSNSNGYDFFTSLPPIL